MVVSVGLLLDNMLFTVVGMFGDPADPLINNMELDIAFAISFVGDLFNKITVSTAGSKQ